MVSWAFSGVVRGILRRFKGFFSSSRRVSEDFSEISEMFKGISDRLKDVPEDSKWFGESYKALQGV